MRTLVAKRQVACPFGTRRIDKANIHDTKIMDKMIPELEAFNCKINLIGDKEYINDTKKKKSKARK